MRVRAIKGFSGFFSTGKPFNMHAGEIREVGDDGTVRELISIGYLEAEQSGQEPAAEAENTPEESADEVNADENKRGKPKRS